MVRGGTLRVDFTLNWTVRGSVQKNGYAIGYGISEPLLLAKNLTRTGDNFVMFNLLDYENVSFSHEPFKLTRIDPYDEDDFRILNLMVNHLINVTTPKDYLTELINTYLPASLNDSLHDEKNALDKYYNYTYTDPVKGNQTITFEHTLDTIDLDQDGLDLYYILTIANFKDFRCGAPVPKK
jgi:hypothetical protein